MKQSSSLFFAGVALLAAWLPASSARAVDPDEEVEVTAGAVTARSCAEQALATGELALLGSACPLAEVGSGIVIVDVAERQIYVPAPAPKKGRAKGAAATARPIPQHQLESAFGGGSIDFTGVVVTVDKAGVATVALREFTVNKKKKAGSFKGCL